MLAGGSSHPTGSDNTLSQEWTHCLLAAAAASSDNTPSRPRWSLDRRRGTPISGGGVRGRAWLQCGYSGYSGKQQQQLGMPGMYEAARGNRSTHTPMYSLLELHC